MNSSRNIVKKWLDLRQGSGVGHRNMDNILEGTSFLANMANTHTYQHVFNKMLSSLEWHPNGNLVVIGSRGGDVSAIDHNTRTVRLCSRGGGRGQQITDIKFDTLDTNWFFTSSTSGKIMKQRLDGTEDIALKDSYVFDEFYSSCRFSCLDICSDRKLLVAGDSKGCIHLMPSCESTKTGLNASCLQIHGSNVLHTEFNKFNTNLFITASIDCTAKLWDVRYIDHKSGKPVLTIRQSRPLNSATFSRTNGSTLLLTNYLDEIGVYRGPDWQLECCIKHSHEQTQRFCLLKARWHPLCDFFLIGSFNTNPLVSGQYYDRPQAIDAIDAQTGLIMSSISDGNPGVISIAQFNNTGDVVAGVKGQNLLIFESIAKD